MFDVCVVGGGAAGMMCALIAARRGLSVVIVEKNEKLGKKLFITGKGRCNFTNACDFDVLQANVTTNPKFLYGAFREFSPQDCISFFEELGLKSKVERGNRMFPVSDKSSDVIKVLERELHRLGVCVRLNTEVKELYTRSFDLTHEENEKSVYDIDLYPERVEGYKPYEKEGSASDCGRKASGYKYVCKGVILQDDERIEARQTVIATGGISYPSTGSTGDGFKFAKNAGLKVTELSPGLVPMNVKEGYAKAMQGLSLKNVEVRFLREKGGKVLYKAFGEMLFTHFGVSGPVILSASSILGDGIYRCDRNDRCHFVLEVDFKPALSAEQLDKRLIRELETGGKKSFKNMLKTLLPASAIPVFANLVTQNPEKRCLDITAGERRCLVKNLKAFTLTVTGLRGYDEAIITRGGVDVKEIDPKSFAARRVSGLYFIGEVLDVDALTGGFNLQIAWSSAVGCARGLTAHADEIRTRAVGVRNFKSKQKKNGV